MFSEESLSRVSLVRSDESPRRTPGSARAPIRSAERPTRRRSSSACRVSRPFFLLMRGRTCERAPTPRERAPTAERRAPGSRHESEDGARESVSSTVRLRVSVRDPGRERRAGRRGLGHFSASEELSAGPLARRGKLEGEGRPGSRGDRGEVGPSPTLRVGAGRAEECA